jgi:hypothetical protein
VPQHKAVNGQVSQCSSTLHERRSALSAHRHLVYDFGRSIGAAVQADKARGQLYNRYAAGTGNSIPVDQIVGIGNDAQTGKHIFVVLKMERMDACDSIGHESASCEHEASCAQTDKLTAADYLFGSNVVILIRQLYEMRQ